MTTALWLSFALVTSSFSTADDFNDNSPGSFWMMGSDPGGSTREINQHLELASAPGMSGSNYAWANSAKGHDFQDASVSIALVDAGNQALSTWAFGFLLSQSHSSYVGFMVSGGNLIAVQRVLGADTNLAQATYVPATMGWLRLRSVAGQLFWETSADGSTWSSFHNAFPAVPLAPVRISLTGGTSQPEAIQTTAIADDFAFTTQAGPATQLAFTTPVRRFTVDTCSGAGNVVTAALLDATGDPTSAGTPSSFILVSGSFGASAFFTDPTCSVSAPGGVFTIPAGMRSTNIYYRDARPGDAPFAMSATGMLTPAASQPHEVGAIAFSDDFETGTVLGNQVPQGAWGWRNSESAMTTLDASADAAHRGNYGLRLVDGFSAAGGGPGSILGQYIEGSNIYWRFWVRAGASNGQGLHTIAAGGDATSLFHTLYIYPATNQMEVAGYSSNRTFFSGDGMTPGMGSGNWHLVEAALTGGGTASAQRRFWFDGKLVSSSAALDLTGLFVSQVNLGQPWSDDRTFQGTHDFDDFRMGQVPLASRLSVEVPPMVAFGACTALTVSLRDSVTGALAAAPYPLTASLGNTGASAGFFSDSSCGAGVTDVAFSSGESARRLYYQGSGRGNALVEADHVDFLSDSVGTTVIDSTPSRLVFVSAPSVTVAGACSAPFEFELQDTYGVAVNPGVASTVTLSTSAGVLYSDASCSTPVTSVPLAAAATRGEFYGRSESAGSLIVTVALPPHTPAAQSWTVQGGPPPADSVELALAVGCGCGASAASGWLAIAAVWLAAMRRAKPSQRCDP